MTLAIVQSGSADGAGADPTITLGAAPTAGNWIVALYMANGAISHPNTSGWTAIGSSVAFGSDTLALYYRKVVVSDSATLPVFESPAATSHQAAIAYEISGAPATWAAALDQAHIDGSTTLSTTFTSGSYTTGVANELVLAMYGTVGFSQPAPTATSPFTQDISTTAGFHSRGSGHNTYASAGASVSMSNGGWGASGASRNAALVFLKPPAAGTGALAFGGIAIAAAGSTIREETGSAALNFAGLSIVADGSDITAPIPPVPPPGTTKKLSVDPLTWNTPIVNPDGTPKQEFQQKWNKQNSVNSAVVSQDYIDTQDAANTAANQKYTQDYGATVLAAAKAYSDSLAVTSGDNVVTMMAAANLNGNFFVKADASGNAAVPDLAVLADGIAVVGITQGAIASGSTGPVQTAGIMSDPSWSWTPGGAIYVGASGLPTQSVPSSKWVLQGGVAVGATTIDISLRYVISTPL